MNARKCSARTPFRSHACVRVVAKLNATRTRLHTRVSHTTKSRFFLSHDLATERCALQIKKRVCETHVRNDSPRMHAHDYAAAAAAGRYSACRRLGSFVLICHRVCLSHLVWFAATHARTRRDRDRMRRVRALPSATRTRVTCLLYYAR